MDFDLITNILQEVCLLDPHLPVVVGVSGGPDSLSLFHILITNGYKVIPAHFDHLLRPGSTKDAEILTKMLDGMGYSLLIGTEDVGSFAKLQGLSTEEAARILRYRFLFEQARRHKAQAVLTAHTADDQVETVLMHILRGSGSSGLTGISYRQIPNEWDATIPLIRPILDIWRNEILEYCREKELSPLIDETNIDTRYLRNRIRNCLIPELEQNYNPQIKNAIIRLSRIIQDDADIIDKTVGEVWRTYCTETGTGYFRFSLDLLRSQIPGIQFQIFRRALKNLVENDEEIGYDTIQKMVDYLKFESRGREIQLVEKIFITIVENDLLICRSECDDWLEMYPQIHSIEILEKNSGVLLGSKWSIQMSQPETCPKEDILKSFTDPRQVFIDAEKLNLPMIVRNIQQGEQFQPYGMDDRSIKLSDFLINMKLPRRVRKAFPVVASGDQIVWIPGYRLAHPFRITRDTTICIKLELIKR